MPTAEMAIRTHASSSAGGSGGCVAIGNALTVETSGNGRPRSRIAIAARYFGGLWWASRRHSAFQLISQVMQRQL